MTKPTKLHSLRGFPGHRFLPPEPEPESVTRLPEPPEFLCEPAVNEWWRLGSELMRIGVLTVADLTVFAAYCQAFGRWFMAEKMLADQGHKLTIEGAIGTNVTKSNPLILIARNAAADMTRYAVEFGCTPIARRRIAAGIARDEKASKFAGLIGQG